MIVFGEAGYFGKIVFKVQSRRTDVFSKRGLCVRREGFLAERDFECSSERGLMGDGGLYLVREDGELRAGNGPRCLLTGPWKTLGRDGEGQSIASTISAHEEGPHGRLLSGYKARASAASLG